MNIFISSGTGVIGRYLRRLLLQEGHLLTIVTRSPEKYASETAKNQQFIYWDADYAEQKKQKDAVINLAGASISGQRWTKSVKERIYSSRNESTKILVDAVKKTGNRPEVFLSGSAAGYYGDRGEQVLDESASSGDDFLSQVCVDWEKEAHKVEEAGVRLGIPR